MKNLLILFLTTLCFNSTQAQKNKGTPIVDNLKKTISWKNYEAREMPVSEFMQNKTALGLGDEDQLITLKETTNSQGISHATVIQTHNGISVEGGVLKIRSKEGSMLTGGGVVTSLDIDTHPSLSEEACLQLALSTMNSEKYAWEMELHENLLKKIEQDENATYYPKGELVIYDNNYSRVGSNYHLAYKFTIFSIKPLSNKTIYVDANTGIITGSIENIHNCTGNCALQPAMAKRNYGSDVNVEVCTDDGIYYLKNSIDGGNTVYNSSGEENYPEDCFTSEDDYFEDDPTANEVYWAINQYYDYLLKVFNRNSIDDNGHALIGFVHFDNSDDIPGYNNAFWAGHYAVFGDGELAYLGGDSLFSSLTSIDIVVHELTHGLIQHTANLVYKDEPGALNESFADIFGILLKEYTGQNNWLIGDDFTVRNTALRSFKNPKENTLYSPQPDTYKGDLWVSSDRDNGGVHYNSGVQNHWFYLLSEGGKGTNDNGYNYDLTGIGIENVAEIAYNNLVYYLTPSSNFIDAREGAIQSAIDLFPDKPEIAEQVKLAWCAVGVGECIPEPVCSREADSLALGVFYFATDGANWINKWDLNQPMNTWYGVNLNAEGCVTHIDLDGVVNWGWSQSEGNNLTGTIPPELGNLKKLVSLHLGYNQLAGNIPSAIGSLTYLEYLGLHGNQLTGSIPTELGNLVNLKLLQLYQNQLTGNLPAQLGELVNMTHLSLHTNQFTGNIPSELRNLSKLEYLALNYNNLTGNLPVELADLKNLETMYVSHNDLNGCFPADLTVLCSQLTHEQSSGNADISNGNNFDTKWEDFCASNAGSCSCNRATDSLALRALYFATDGANWTIPWDLSKPMDTWYGVKLNENGCVIQIDLDGEVNWSWSESEFGGNNLIGTIPAELGGLNFLHNLNLANNQLIGDIPPELGGLSNLYALDLHSNQLTGNIPPEIGKLNKTEWLLLYNNQLSGSIPPELGNLNSLFHLSLSTNQLSGSIPPELANLDKLSELFLNNNNLIGSILSELGNLSNLKILNLSVNQLDGSIPIELGNLSNLETFHLSNNQLEGCYPPNLKNLCSQLENSGNDAISNGNNFEAPWEEFCATGAGSCPQLCDPESDRNALIAFYNATRGWEWDIVWDLSQPMDTWYGVKLNEAGCVTHIDLDGEVNWTWSESKFGGNNLIGTIPAELGSLKFLYILILANNQQLTGNIPPELGKLSNLYALDLHSNQLTGSIPPELANLNKMEWLLLYENQLSGNIPSQLGNLSSLFHLSIGTNQLSGNIPPELGNLNKLGELELEYNNLTGSIPSGLSKLNNLEVLNLSFNELGGSIPIELANLSNLETLNLRNNQLTGEIPSNLAQLDSLFKLDLSSNNLTGNIPSKIGNITSLTHLILRENELVGSIPSNFQNLSNLETLSLSNNQLIGNIPIELERLFNLNTLVLSSNQLTGSIPSELANLSFLTKLFVSHNQLEGCYPPELKSLCSQLDNSSNDDISNGNNFEALWEDFCATDAGICPELICDPQSDKNALIALHDSTNGEFWNEKWDLSQPVDTWYGVKLNAEGCVSHIDLDGEANWNWNEISGNNLTGNIPPEIGNLKHLTFLKLSGNQLNGSIPSELGGLSYLRVLEIYSNKLSGSIPPELGNLIKLRHFNLSRNDITGSIPAELENLKNLRYLGLQENNLTGSIPPQLGNLSGLGGLGLGENQLSGTIPIELGKLSQLTRLSFYSNDLSGSIPPELGNLTNLTYLDLPGNNLTGNIPPELGNLSNLIFLQLGWNQLEGSIPIELSNLTNLNFLDLSDNELSGGIPKELGNLDSITTLKIPGCGLVGSIPPELSNLSKLTRLTVNSNDLSGCYSYELKSLCNQLTSDDFKGNASINDGNDFDATWDDFCATEAGICEDDFVLPGDFNNDGCLSYTDVLIWGLAEGNIGSPRSDATNEWNAQKSPDWNGNVNGINSKHQDANGDGIVDIADLYVFVDNFEIDSTRCESGGVANARQESTDHIILNQTGTEVVNDKIKKLHFELSLASKFDDADVSLHGLVFDLHLEGYKKVIDVELDTSPFKSEVEQVDTLFESNGNYIYSAAVTKTNKNNITFDKDIPTVIIVVTIEDLQSSIHIDGTINTGGRYVSANPGALLKPLTGTSVLSVSDPETEINATLNIVTPTKHSKGSVEVFVQGGTPPYEYGLNNFNDDNVPTAIPNNLSSENSFDISESGIYKITVIDSEGKSFEKEIELDGSGGIINPVLHLKFTPLQTSPNPAASYIEFSLGSGYCYTEVDKMEVYNINGRLIHLIQPQTKNDCIYTVNIAGISPGMYFLNIIAGDNIFNSKFIKQ